MIDDLRKLIGNLSAGKEDTERDRRATFVDSLLSDDIIKSMDFIDVVDSSPQKFQKPQAEGSTKSAAAGANIKSEGRHSPCVFLKKIYLPFTLLVL